MTRTPDTTDDAVATRPPTGARGSAAESTKATMLEHALDKAVRIPSGTIHKHVDALRARNPEAGPERIIALLGKEYLRVLEAAGGSVGAAATLPGIGTGVGVALTGADMATFFAASAAYSLGVADVHGIEVEDLDRRRALLLASVLGDEGASAVAAAGNDPTSWGRALLAYMPTSTIRQVNKALTGRFVRRYLMRRSGVMLGRLLPFGVGAVVGVLGGRALGKTVIAQTQEAFGLPPSEFGVPVRVVETGGRPSLVAGDKRAEVQR